jgi:predicted transcriptional regulator
VCGGEVEYNKVMASVYRAIKRLKQRGLLEDTAWAYYLTDAGVAVAQNIAPTAITGENSKR